MGGMKGWRDDWLDYSAGLFSERLFLMGSAAVGEVVQTRHVVCRKNMRGGLLEMKLTDQMLTGNDKWILLWHM